MQKYRENAAYFTLYPVANLREPFSYGDMQGGCLDAPELIPVGSTTFQNFFRTKNRPDFLSRAELAFEYEDALRFEAFLAQQR